MKAKIINVLILGASVLFFAGTTGVSAGEPRVKKRDPIVFFWYHFRTAVINSNLPKLTGLTHFPFESRDSNGKSIKISKGRFSGQFRPLLDETTVAGRSMREIIAEKEDLTVQEREALMAGEVQIGSFIFRKMKNDFFFAGAALAPAAVVPPPSVDGSAQEAETDPRQSSVFR